MIKYKFYICCLVFLDVGTSPSPLWQQKAKVHTVQLRADNVNGMLNSRKHIDGTG